MKKVKYLLFLFIGITLISMIIYHSFRLYDYEFPVFDGELHVFTKKMWGGKFLVMFSKDENSLKQRNGVDSLETATDAYIWIGFDKKHKKEITITTPSVIKQSFGNYDITFIEEDDEEGNGYRVSKFFDENRHLREQYMVMVIDASSYHVMFDKKVLHQSNLLGR